MYTNLWIRGPRALPAREHAPRRTTPPPSRRRRATAIGVAALIVAGLAATPALAADEARGGLPDAELFATNNTEVITDPAHPQLSKRLKGFARKVERIIDQGGGTPLGSQLLDGVFFSSDFNTTTFERSRDFDVDDVSDAELGQIAETIRQRFRQQSVLTFDYLPAQANDVDGVELVVPGVTAQALRDGLLADQTARETLFGGSVTLDGELILVAELANVPLAREFAEKIGGDLSRAVVRTGDVEFVG